MKLNKIYKFMVAGVLFMPMQIDASNEAFRNRNLSPEERAEDLVSRLTLDEKVSLMMDVSPAIERLGIPEYNWWNEALHGVGRAGIATVLPQSIGMAATFDENVVEKAFDMVSDEARAKYNIFRKEGKHGRYQGLSFWTPNVNIFRDPRWGRGQETYGEDPYLTSQMGVAVVKGLQGDKNAGHVKSLAGAKHFAVHSGPEWNRHSFDANKIDQRDLWETYLPAFKELVDAGVWQVMCAYNRFEGEPCCSSDRLLTQILRNEWGYDKIIVTDCWAMNDFFNPGAHATHKNGVDASAEAVASGTDLECGSVFANLKEACEKGLIDEASIDRSVKRLLMARFALGELDDAAYCEWSSLPETVIDSEDHKRIALDMARKSMTLLKNNGILPLSKDNRSIIVMGPNANDSVMQWGNYNGFPSHTVTVLEGIRSKIGDVEYLRGCDHVVNNNIVSHFDGFSSDGMKGMTGKFWNERKPGKGKPVAESVYSSPLNFSTGGATVFAPNVNLTDFSALFSGKFIPSETGEYIIKMSADDGWQTASINGEKVFENFTEESVHDNFHVFHAEKGKEYDVELFYSHGKGLAHLKFDIGKAEDYDINTGNAETVIFVGGISPALEGEEMPVSVEGFRGGDRETIELPKIQRDLMKELKRQNKKIVFVNCSGSAVALAPEDSICDAILQAWYPGQAGGTAVAEVLFGDYNPAGRLPVSFYKDDSQLPDFEDYDMLDRTYRYMKEKPLYPFGYGLSYSTFRYKDARIEKGKKAGDPVAFSFTLTNDSDTDGEEVVQVYVKKTDDYSGPVKTLRAYRRVPVAAGESKRIDFSLDAKAFATFDPESGRMQTLPGDYIIYYGGTSDTDLHIPVTLR